MAESTLDKHLLSTYFTLRIGVAVIAIVLPLLLWIGGKFYAGIPLQESMSAYYHADNDGKSMRDWFVGILFAAGVFLYLYKGYSNKENIALNIAGLLAVGVAIFPMEWNCGDSCQKFSLHGACAIGFFLSIAFVCIRCAPETVRLIKDESQRFAFRRRYKFLAALMLASPIIAFALNSFARILDHQYNALVFYVEAMGIFAFAAYWLTKSRELALTQAERKALKGQIERAVPVQAAPTGELIESETVKG